MHLVIQHDGADVDRFFTVYAHLQSGSIPAEVDIDRSVIRGQLVGRSGNTGKTIGRGFHLHFQIDKDLGGNHPYWCSNPDAPPSDCVAKKTFDPIPFILAHAASPGMNDDFDDNILDLARWELLVPPPGFFADVAETNQRLEIEVGPGMGGGGVVSRYPVHGDFDVQVDYSLTVWPARNPYGLRLGATDLGVGPFGLVAMQRNSSTVSDFEFYTVVFSDSASQTPTTHTSGGLRLVRSGSTLSGYFMSETGWVLVGSGVTTTSPTRFNLDVGTADPSASGGIRITFDNFRVNAGTVEQSNARS